MWWWREENNGEFQGKPSFRQGLPERGNQYLWVDMLHQDFKIIAKPLLLVCLAAPFTQVQAESDPMEGMDHS
ncbi:hypothetical protein, partial [Methylovulum sp.]|uniref:hypothetical protein n=1 Tax=Methylovulum sp. TaxID=1916980 RepID=UPI00262CB0D2